MPTAETVVKNLKPVTPDEIQAKNGKKTIGNKEAFLRVARGLLTEKDAKRLREIIEESCEQIDE